MEEQPVVDADTPGLREYLGSGYERVRRFGELLADHGVTRGLIGPREVPRLWDRHLLNSAAVAQYLPPDGTLIDVGTGAGLPGVVLACMRPDLHVVLLEPMERRVAWLTEVVAELELEATEVVRGRAEGAPWGPRASAVTARAVAPMDRLASWTLPLLEVGGVLLAMKGSRAGDEVESARAQIDHLGGGAVDILSATTIPEVTATVVVRVMKDREPVPQAPSRTPGSGRKARRKKG